MRRYIQNTHKRQSERSYRQNFTHERWVHLDLNNCKVYLLNSTANQSQFRKIKARFAVLIRKQITNWPSNFWIPVSQFWCWSRRDYSEGYIQSLNISTNLLYEDNFWKPFTSSFEKNGTKIRCNSGLEWSQDWIETGNTYWGTKILCGTSTFLVANFFFQPSLENEEPM